MGSSWGPCWEAAPRSGLNNQNLGQNQGPGAQLKILKIFMSLTPRVTYGTPHMLLGEALQGQGEFFPLGILSPFSEQKGS